MINDDTGLLIQWLAVSHRPELRWDEAFTRRYFLPKPQPGFLRKLGIPENYTVTPYSLTPHDSFYLLTSRDLPGATFSHEQRHLPYHLRLLDFDATIISIVSRLYPMGIQTVRITARLRFNQNGDYNEMLSRLQPLRKAHTVCAANHIIRMALALATGDRSVDMSSLSYQTFFGMQASLPVQADQMPSFISDHQPSVIALLIGNLQPKALSAQIIENITSENQRINEKSGFEYLLMNRGGLVYLVPKDGYRSPHPERFRRSVDIAELALYAKAFLDFASDERRRNENLVDFLLSKIETWVSAPQVIFSSSMTSQLQWEVLAGALSLRLSLEQWKKSQGESITWESKVDIFRKVPRDWYLIPELAKFLDDLTSP